MFICKTLEEAEEMLQVIDSGVLKKAQNGLYVVCRESEENLVDYYAEGGQ